MPTPETRQKVSLAHLRKCNLPRTLTEQSQRIFGPVQERDSVTILSLGLRATWMRMSLALLTVAVAAMLASGGLAQSKRETFVKVPKVPYGELPSGVQSRIDTVQLDCLVPPGNVAQTSAFVLDVNHDFTADFIFIPGYGNQQWPRGYGGLCDAADGTREVLYVSDGSDRYRELVLGSIVAVLKSQDDVIFTGWCGGNHAQPNVSLAVFDNRTFNLAPFGKCYSTLGAALSAARRKGYRVVELR